MHTCAQLIVGMHPDQASEAIVEFARANGKPLALVPCCVYSSEPQFRARLTRDGRSVRSYDQFVGYLQHKYSLSCQTLPFEGKNKVLYSKGSWG